MLTAGACLGLGNIALGFALGLALVWGFRVAPHGTDDAAPRGSR